MSSSAPDPDLPPAPELIEAAAAAWLSLRDRGMNAAETAEFMRWLQQDPQHAAVFAELDGMWKDFDRLGAVPAATTADAPAPDCDLLAPRVRHRRHWTMAWGVLGAAAAAAVVLLAVHHFRTPRLTAETAVGAFQKLDLPDGSVAQLNTDSAIAVAFSATERRVRIIRGEVFFNVTKDPARPFIVTAGLVAVRAVGTAFNVRRHAAAVEVLVTEGRVGLDDASQGRTLLAPVGPQLEPPLLVAGERAVVRIPGDSRGAMSARVEQVPLLVQQRSLAWQERRLEFDAVPLAEVVAEFNRYNRLQLVIGDPRLAGRRFSGTFRADGYEALVRLLEEDFGLSAVRGERTIVLQSGR